MRRDVPTVHRETPIADAVDVLANGRHACAVVVDDEGRPEGIVTERDLLALAEDQESSHLAVVLRRMLLEEHHIFSTMRDLRKAAAQTVGDVASSPVKCAEADMTVAELASMMERYDYRQLPVVREGRLVGVVGRQEIVRAIADQT